MSIQKQVTTQAIAQAIAQTNNNPQASTNPAFVNIRHSGLLLR
jgi:hypothetical protein